MPSSTWPASAAATANPVIRQGLAAAYTGTELLRFLSLRMQSARRGQQAPAPSLLKLFNAHQQKRINELALSIEGAYGTLSGSDGTGTGSWQYKLPEARAAPHRRRQRRDPAQRHRRAYPRPARRAPDGQGDPLPGRV